MKKIQTHIGHEIAKRRTALNLSQEELAERAGLSRITIVRIENGGQIPGTKTLTNICGTLGLSLDDLYTVQHPDPTYTDARLRLLIHEVEKLSPGKQEQFFQMA